MQGNRAPWHGTCLVILGHFYVSLREHCGNRGKWFTLPLRVGFDFGAKVCIASGYETCLVLTRDTRRKINMKQPLRSDPAPSRGFVLTKPYVVQVEHRQDTKVTGIEEQLLMGLNAEH